MNNIFLNKHKFVLICICLLADIALHGQLQDVTASTPYGDIEFSDDDNSSLILNSYAKPSGDYRTDSLNTRAIISVCDVADGALAEMMDNICYEDFCNKPNVVVDIYARDKGALEKYINCIASELYFFPDSTLNHLDKLVKRVSKDINNYNDLIALSEIMSIIRIQYIKYKDEDD